MGLRWKPLNQPTNLKWSCLLFHFSLSQLCWGEALEFCFSIPICYIYNLAMDIKLHRLPYHQLELEALFPICRVHQGIWHFSKQWHKLIEGDTGSSNHQEFQGHVFLWACLEEVSNRSGFIVVALTHSNRGCMIVPFRSMFHLEMDKDWWLLQAVSFLQSWRDWGLWWC